MIAPPIAMTPTVGRDGAPLLVLGCSLGTAASLWRRAAPLLAQSHRVTVWELPGHGDAAPARETFSIRDLADAVATSFDQPFAYAGVSIGGAVALELAAHHPDRVAAAVAICSAAQFGAPDDWHARAAQVRASGTASLVSTAAERWFAPSTLARSPDDASTMLHALRDADDASYAWCCDALADFDARSSLAAIETPFLAAWGEHDAVTPRSLAEEIAAGIPRGVVAPIPGASHLAPIDAPDLTARTLLDFLSSVEGARS